MSRRGSLRIASREVRALFDSPGGCLVVGTFWLVAGIFLVSLLYGFRQESLRLAQSGATRAGPVGVHVNDAVVQPLLVNLGLVLVFFVPILTMRSFADERRAGSLELLLSQPLRGSQVLLGKFLGAWFSLGICLSVLLLHGLALAWVSRPDWGAAATGLLGLLLLSAFLTSVGILVSAISRSSIESAVLSLGALLALAIGPNSVRPGGPTGEAIVSFLSVMSRFERFTLGVFDLGNVAFFLGASLLVLAVALRSLDLLRWQGS